MATTDSDRGPRHRSTTSDVLHFNSMPRWRDHRRLAQLRGVRPAGTRRAALAGVVRTSSQGESPADWRDRLYQLYRIPYYQAGQSDLKAAYVEIASPLFVREIIELTRTHPEHLRNGKRLFTEVVAPHDVPDRIRHRLRAGITART